MTTSAKVLRDSLGGVAAFGLRGGVGALVGIGVSIALARMLTPVEFGIFATMLVFLNAVSSIRDFGLASALLYQDEEPTLRESRTAFTLQLLFCATVYGLIFGLKEDLLTLFKLPAETAQFLMALSMTVFLLPFSSVGGMYIHRRLAYRKIAVIEFVHQLVYGITAVALAWFGWGLWSFGIAYILAASLRIGLLFAAAPWPVGLAWDTAFLRWGLIYGGKLQVAGMVSLLRDGMPAMLGGAFWGPQTVGYLNWASRLSQQVGQSVSSVVSQVMFPSLSRLKNDRQSSAVMVATAIRYINILSLPILAIVCVLATELVSYVYTDKWAAGIPALYWFALGMAGQGLSMTLDHLLKATGRAGLSLTITVAWTAVSWIAGVGLGMAWGFTGLAMGYTLGAWVSVVCLVVATREQYGFSLSYVFVNPALAAAVAALGVFAIKPALADSLGGLLACMLLGCTLFGLALLGLERERLWRELITHANYCRQVLLPASPRGEWKP